MAVRKRAQQNLDLFEEHRNIGASVNETLAPPPPQAAVQGIAPYQVSGQDDEAGLDWRRPHLLYGDVVSCGAVSVQGRHRHCYVEGYSGDDYNKVKK